MYALDSLTRSYLSKINLERIPPLLDFILVLASLSALFDASILSSRRIYFYMKQASSLLLLFNHHTAENAIPITIDT